MPSSRSLVRLFCPYFSSPGIAGAFFIAVGLPDGLAVLVESAAADDALMDQALG